MDQTRFDQSMKVLAGSAGRRDAVRSLGAIGTALLAGLGFAEASRAAGKHDRPGGNDGGNDRNRRGMRHPLAQNGSVQAERKKRNPCRKSCPAGSNESTRLVNSALSDPLPVTAGSNVSVAADCGGKGRVVSCGYQMSASPAQLANAFVVAVVPQDDEMSQCTATLARTTDVGSTAGAAILAIAICRD